jgi:hypothetical protein
MFETIKELADGEMLTIDSPDVRDFTDAEDFEVAGVRSYSQDEGEIVFVDLNGFYLVAHTFAGEPRYYVYELTASGEADQVEDDGFRLASKSDSMPAKVYAGRTGSGVKYKATIGPVYGLNVDRDDAGVTDEAGEIAVCEYRGKTKIRPLGAILIERLDDHLSLYRGLSIAEGSIVL